MENDDNLKLVAKGSGGIVVLMDVLNHGTDKQNEDTVGVKTTHAIDRNNKKIIKYVGGLIPLIHQIKFGTNDERISAVKTLSGLVKTGSIRR